jgi:hypothetical protein
VPLKNPRRLKGLPGTAFSDFSHISSLPFRFDDFHWNVPENVRGFGILCKPGKRHGVSLPVN